MGRGLALVALSVSFRTRYASPTLVLFLINDYLILSAEKYVLTIQKLAASI